MATKYMEKKKKKFPSKTKKKQRLATKTMTGPHKKK